MEISMKKYVFPLLLVLVFSFFTIKPLFTAGFFPMHDDTQVQRVYEMWSSLKDGTFPVRWVSDLGYGYGYPIYNFYGPLAYYLGGVLVFITQNALFATKLMFGVGILLAGVTMYLFANSLGGKYAGIISALLYVYAPYHAVNIYVRGDVAEFFAYAFLPLIFYGITEYVRSYSKSALILGSIGYAGVILSHNLSAMMLTPCIGLFLIFYFAQDLKKSWKKNLWLLFIPLVGILLAGFYWLPALGEMQYTNVLSQIGGGSDFRDHFVCLSQLWSSQWGYGGSIPGCVDGLSLQIGKVQIILFILGFGTMIWKKRSDIIVLAALGIFSVFFTVPYSRFIWESIHAMAFFQFPWRFLMPTSFFFSVVGGIGVGVLLDSYLKKEWLLWSATLVVGIGISVYSMKFFIPQTTLAKSSDDYTNNQFLKWNTSKISDEYMPKGFEKPTAESGIVDYKIFAPHQDVQIKTITQKVTYQKYQITTPMAERLHFYTAYFPAWHLFINGKEEPYIIKPNNGLYYLVPRSGIYTVELRFLQTPLERAANVVSFVGIIIVGLGIIKGRTHEKKS
jgi:hypothetical protein